MSSSEQGSLENYINSRAPASPIGVSRQAAAAASAMFQYETALNDALADPSVSFALRERLLQDKDRDPVDAVSDATELLRIANLRLEAAMQHAMALHPEVAESTRAGFGTGVGASRTPPSFGFTTRFGSVR